MTESKPETKLELKTEEDVARYWGENEIPKKVLEANSGNAKYYFLDGPPYATGSIHLGTALNKILKDYYLRFWRMRGYDVWSQPGYDTHGLPIENRVEKALGLKDKKDIEGMGVEKFILECKKFATQHIDVMNQQFANLGVWMDWDNPYLTLSNEYIEGAWYTFKVAYEKGLLYKGKYPVHVCPHCQTVVAYNEIIYFKSEDPSIYVKFKVKGKEDEYLVIWTTTPWTLPANTGVMVHPKETYVKIETAIGKLIVAKARLADLAEKLEMGYRIIEEFPGENLVGLEYENPLREFVPVQRDVVGRVVPSAQFVTMDTGSGLVHCAPGHGKEDYKVGRENGLSQLSPVGLDGRFTDEAGKYAGMYVKDANPVIIDDLRKMGALLYAGKIVHDYPKCWRCDTPLIMISVPQWFFAVSKIRKKMLEENKHVKWVPAWAGKRFDDWLQGLDDWPISRQRYWGIPLPIWVCNSCGEIKVVGSRDELPNLPEDLHKPYIDNIKLKCKCGGEMERVPDVLDVWFDSGVAAWASLGFPRKKELFNRLWPVDHVLEGSDQFRGWWNSSMICSVITFDRRPYDAIVYHGLVLDAHGVKMAKSKGNVVTPEQVIEKYSRDALRHYFLRNDPGADINFDWKKMEEYQKFFRILANVYKFFALYGDKIPMESVKERLRPEDKWVISRINTVAKNVEWHSEQFRAFKAIQELEDFAMNDLSRTYIKLIRDRTWPSYNGEDKAAAQATLYYVLDRLARLLAPVAPYLAERFYQNVLGGKKESVHLEKWPGCDETMIDPKLEEAMGVVEEISDAVVNARQLAKIKLRWPIDNVEVVSEDKGVNEALDIMQDVLLKMTNAKSIGPVKGEYVEIGFSRGKVKIGRILSDELKLEALASEIVRHVQEARKRARMDVSEEISLSVRGSPLLEELWGELGDFVKRKVNTKEIKVGKLEGELKGEFQFLGERIEFAFSKV